MTIQELRDQVAAQRSVVNSAIELLNGLHQKLDDAIKSGDPAAVQGVADDLKANTDALAQAVVANTPATPSAPPAPTPTP